MSHSAGLAWTDAKITFEDAKDWKKMSELFENETPKWEPGTAVGYHALTYGWLVDQIIRRVDPKHRSIGQFFREEFQQPLGLDLHIGLPKSEAYRVARIRLPSFFQRISEFVHNPDAVNYPKFLYEFAIDGMISKVEKNPDWLRFVKEMTLNNPEIYELEQGAVMGTSTAKSLAKLFSIAIIEKKMFKEETIQKMLTPFNQSKDLVTGALVSRGQGFMFTDFQTCSGIKCRVIGHSGYGGQNIKFDPKYKVSFAYLSNGLKAGFGDSARTFVRLRDSIYDVLTKN
uniref:Beta-lactamase-related domain-containing protein n=1 Tax=Panagrolaimus sp. JU765 TaxID=591449 RepID=A0AC34RH47_9BILA